MYVSGDNTLSKLWLVGEAGKSVVDLVWDNRYHSGGRWVTQEVPEDKEIIGFYCGIEGQYYIKRLGFILWTPNPNAQ